MAESFSNRLNVAMAFRNVKQIDFVHAAEKFNIKLGKSHMSQYVSGKTVPRADIAHFLAAFLQVNEDWLMGKDVPMEQNVATLPAIKSDEAQHDSNPASAQSTEGKTMRTFTKSHKLDNVLYDVRGPVADEAARMEAAGTHILKLNIGNPAPFGFRTPDEVVYDMAQQLPETEGYSPSKGLFSARKAIMQYAQLKNIPNVSIDDIFTGNGVSELINLSLSALLDDGDEVLVPSPDYPLWTACVNLAGGTAVHYICDEGSEWYPDIDDIRSKITDKTKAIVIINPNNPTGALYPKELLQQIVDIAREHQLIIFSDEIYDRLVMDGAYFYRIAGSGPVLCNVLRSVEVAYDCRISHWMDDTFRQQAYCEGLHRGLEHAGEHAYVLECPSSVGGTDRFGRASERQGLHQARWPCVRAARTGLSDAQ